MSRYVSVLLLPQESKGEEVEGDRLWFSDSDKLFGKLRHGAN